MFWSHWFGALVLTVFGCLACLASVNGVVWRERMFNQSFYVQQCMVKIVEVIQPCSEQAVTNWNLNHSLFVASLGARCCANWQVYDCFIQASLEYCSLLEFHALVQNMTIDAFTLQKTNCSRYKYHSEACAILNRVSQTTQPRLLLLVVVVLLVAIHSTGQLTNLQ